MEFGKKLFTELALKVEAFCVKKYGQNLCNCLKNQNKLKTHTGFYPTLYLSGIPYIFIKTSNWFDDFKKANCWRLSQMDSSVF